MKILRNLIYCMILFGLVSGNLHSQEPAVIKIDFDRKISVIDSNIYGAFVEPIRTVVNGTIYDPASSLADENGFRKDFIQLIRELKIPVLRWPGGNFVSGYNWEDGIGPKAQRPVRLDLAWNQVDKNQMGTDEYAKFCSLIDAKNFVCINGGTGTLDQAKHWVDSPRSGGVELDVGAPMLECLARLANFFVGEGDVVVRVGVGGRELDGGLVGGNGFLHPSGFVEHVPQVEVGEGIAGIDLDGRAVVLLGEQVFLPVVVERAQVDVRGGVIGIHVQNLQVNGDGFALGRGVFFEHDAAGKQVGDVGDDQFRPGAGRAGYNFFFGSEIEHELSRDGLKQVAVVAKGDAVSALIGAGFEQRILHAGNALLHGLERLADDGRTHALGAQVADFLDLEQFEEGITFRRGHKTSFLPSLELAGSEPENAQQICSAITVHGG